MHLVMVWVLLFTISKVTYSRAEQAGICFTHFLSTLQTSAQQLIKNNCKIVEENTQNGQVIEVYAVYYVVKLSVINIEYVLCIVKWLTASITDPPLFSKLPKSYKLWTFTFEPLLALKY